MDHAISNIVLYLQEEDGDFVKVKVDSFDEGSQEVFDADDLDLAGFVADEFPGMDLVALTVKAGDNHPEGYGPGEGELFILDQELSEADLPTGASADEEYQFSDLEDDLLGGDSKAGQDDEPDDEAGGSEAGDQENEDVDDDDVDDDVDDDDDAGDTGKSGSGTGADQDDDDAEDLELEGGKGDDLLEGGAGDDLLEGNKGDDELYGQEGDDELYGGKGDDTLYGQEDDDLMMGGDGNDTFYGGGGEDEMYGEAGNDLFIFGSDQDGGFVDGGVGGDWTDVIDLTETGVSSGPGGGDWTLEIEGDSITDASQHGAIDLNDASGTITFNETEEVIEFDHIDRIEW
ncbi:MAG: hypothetical protein HQL52_06500 [Magnetococcales bacterium]|nr:hypothetical protein [Magnetococcales bacterium]